MMRFAVAREILRQGAHVDAGWVTGGFQSFPQFSLRGEQSGAAFILNGKRQCDAPFAMPRVKENNRGSRRWLRPSQSNRRQTTASASYSVRNRTSTTPSRPISAFWR
jgi:hypothetical protein